MMVQHNHCTLSCILLFVNVQCFVGRGQAEGGEIQFYIEEYSVANRTDFAPADVDFVYQNSVVDLDVVVLPSRSKPSE